MKVPKIRGKRIVALWAGVAVLLFLFPHYLLKAEEGMYLDAGWGFFLTGPVTRGHDDWETRALRARFKLPSSMTSEAVWDSARTWAIAQPGNLFATNQELDVCIKKAIQKDADPRVTRKGGFNPRAATVDHGLLVLMQAVLAGIMAAWLFVDRKEERP